MKKVIVDFNKINVDDYQNINEIFIDEKSEISSLKAITQNCPNVKIINIHNNRIKTFLWIPKYLKKLILTISEGDLLYYKYYDILRAYNFKLLKIILSEKKDENYNPLKLDIEILNLEFIQEIKNLNKEIRNMLFTAHLCLRRIFFKDLERYIMSFIEYEIL
jgi:hypothetical protein